MLRDNRLTMSEEEPGRATTAPQARHAALGLGPEKLRAMYRQLVLSRAIDRRMSVLNRHRKAPIVVSAQRQDAAQVGCAEALPPGVDRLAPCPRALAFCVALGMTGRDFMLGVFARATDPCSGGRQMPSHWGLRRARILSTSSTVATQVLHAAGIAYAARLRGLDEVVVTCLGEGSTSKGDWHEGLNFAGVHRLPLVCLVQDNDYAISVPRRLQMGVESVAERARGYGMTGVTVDGGDVLAVYETAAAAVERARSGEGPTLIDAKVARFTSHSSDDDQRRYRPREELEALLRRDPLERFRNYLLDEGLLTEAGDEQVQQECAAEVDEAVTAAEAAPQPDPADLERHVFAAEPQEEEDPPTPPLPRQGGGS